MAENKYNFVLDCSFTMAWCFEDEADELTDSVLEGMNKAKAVVPTIWPLEVANFLLIAQKNKRITAIQTASFIDALSILPIVVDHSTSSRAMHSIFTLAQELALTIYDAAYLELALRENIPLLTLDKNLIKAAKKQNISVLLNNEMRTT